MSHIHRNEQKSPGPPLMLVLMLLLRLVESSVDPVCNLRHNASFAAMQPVTVGAAETAAACCARLHAENRPGGRCNSSDTAPCKYFRWTKCLGICSPFPSCLGNPPLCPKHCPFCTNNCELHVAAGPYLPPEHNDFEVTTTGWVSGAAEPKEPLPPERVVEATYHISAAGGLGLEWEGVGAISGGGATTKLLMDYDDALASDILDYMFKPNFGLALQVPSARI